MNYVNTCLPDSNENIQTTKVMFIIRGCRFFGEISHPKKFTNDEKESRSNDDGGTADYILKPQQTSIASFLSVSTTSFAMFT